MADGEPARSQARFNHLVRGEGLKSLTPLSLPTSRNEKVRGALAHLALPS
jgi:hypothetical protein